MTTESFFEVYTSLSDAENRAKELYTIANPKVVFGSWWIKNGYILVKDQEFWLKISV